MQDLKLNASLAKKINNLTTDPGVYKMLDADNKIIYIGKAKNLKKRVSQYFSNNSSSYRIEILKEKINNFDIFITKTETQALLLENDLIKKYQPKYNVLLKDSKTYPYIFISKDKHSRIGISRSQKNPANEYFGPYTSKNVARYALDVLKKVFKIRDCSNSFYKLRTRPCLEYQIGICSAPCVNKISDKNYQQNINMVKLFLNGKNTKVLENIANKMQDASKELDFEAAASYRDQLIRLRTIQEKHSSRFSSDMDIVYIASKEKKYCIKVLFIRDGKQIDAKTFFPNNPINFKEEDILSSFLPWYYLNKKPPKEIVVNKKLSDKKIIENAILSKIINSPQSNKKHFLELAKINAKEELKQHLLVSFSKKNQLEFLQKDLLLEKLPMLIECFDISHTMGKQTVASCVVFTKGTPAKRQYRHFIIKDIIAGDDCAAIAQAVFRRYSRALKEKKKMPDIILIDGGVGQLNSATMAMNSIGIDNIKLIGVAKHSSRKSGLETLVMLENDKVKKVNLRYNSPSLLLINHIVDEAHRFALKNHRQKRLKSFKSSVLDSIEGIGAKKKAALFNHFGGLQEIKQASSSELQKINGINAKLAYKIIDSLKEF